METKGESFGRYENAKLGEDKNMEKMSGKRKTSFIFPPNQEEQNEISPRNTFRRKEKGDDKEVEQGYEQEAEEKGQGHSEFGSEQYTCKISSKDRNVV